MQRRKGGDGRDGRRPPDLREKVSVEQAFGEIDSFRDERRVEYDMVISKERWLLEVFTRFTPMERVRFFAKLYDRFAEDYDRHMGEDTNHFDAMRKVLTFAGPNLQAPMLDITAGTGELLKYALEMMRAGRILRHERTSETGILVDEMPFSERGIVVGNEISSRMLGIARAKLQGFDVKLTPYNAFELPSNWWFRTILCSQTFHLLPDEDKTRLVKAMHWLLAPGGIAIVIEEDPFLVSATPSIGVVDIFIRAIAKPIKNKATLIAYFENEGFGRFGDRASAPIDADHVMRLHIFQKK